MKKLFLIIIVNIAVFCTVIIVVELSGQITYYLLRGKFIYQVVESDNEHIFELHPHITARLIKNISFKDKITGITITTTKRNTRWTGAPEDDSNLIRVVVLGGSSAFGTFVTDSDSWPALLQAKLGDQFSVINYGIPSFTSTESIVQLALVIPEINPDFVILYEGWNDLYQYHLGESADYYNHGIQAYSNLEIPMIYKEQTLLERLYDLSAIVRLSTIIKEKLFPPSDTQICATFDSPDPFIDRVYIRNLKTQKLLSEQIATYTLFVPQVMNYHRLMENKDPGWATKKNLNEDCNTWVGDIKNTAVPRLMDRFNSLMQPICSYNDPKCLFVDSVLKVSWEPDDFMDIGHFSRKGGEKFSDILSQVILSKVKEGKLDTHLR